MPGSLGLGDAQTVQPELARLPWKIRNYTTAEGGLAFLMLTAAGDHFIKVRMSAKPDARVGECAKASFEQLLHLADVIPASGFP